MDFKELYIQEVERLASEYEEAGMDSNKAYDLAGEKAYDSARDILADAADVARKRRLEDGE